MSIQGTIGMTPSKIIITGGIATGKSTVTNYLREKGYPVFDADACAKRALEIGQAPYACVIERFGQRILQNDGKIDREALAKIVFSDDDARQQLNACVHPWVFKQLDVWTQEQTADLLFYDIPLHFETGAKTPGEVWLVATDEDTQRKRLMERNALSEEDATARINAQWPMDEKRKGATKVLENTGTMNDLYAQIDALLEERECPICKS